MKTVQASVFDGDVVRQVNRMGEIKRLSHLTR